MLAVWVSLPTAVAQDDLHSRLVAAVDRPTREERASAARKLARDRNVDLDAWLVALRAFGQFEAFEPGRHEETVPLSVDGELVPTPITYRIPSTYEPTRPAALLVVLHGTGGSGRAMDVEWRTVADELGMLLVAPSETGENQGYESTRRERQGVLAALRWARRRFNVDERRVFLSGVSRGGHLTWDLVLRFPDRWAAIAPLIGGPRLTIENGQNNLRFIENLRATPIRDLQGEHDHPLLLFNLHLAFERLAALDAVDAQLITFPDRGHAYDFGAVDWTAFLGGTERDPAPAELVHRCASEAYGRHAWIEVLDLERGTTEEFRPEVDAQEWNRLGDEERRRVLQREADQRTARLAARRIGSGQFEVETERVKQFRLPLRAEDFHPDQPVVVRVDGKTTQKRVRPDAETLLVEFVERFDRSFLPVAELRLR